MTRKESADVGVLLRRRNSVATVTSAHHRPSSIAEFRAQRRSVLQLRRLLASRRNAIAEIDARRCRRRSSGCRPRTARTRRSCSAARIPDSPTPQTAAMPQPRATSAAWLTMPPVAVTMPADFTIPCTSSGDVVGRTRITLLPPSAIAATRSGMQADDAARDTGRRRDAGCDGGRAGAHAADRLKLPQLLARERRTASSRAISARRSLAISTAIRAAAAIAERLPTRTCRICSRPSCTVNSTSQRSR